MNGSRWSRWAPLSGVVFVVLWLVSVALFNNVEYLPSVEDINDRLAPTLGTIRAFQLALDDMHQDTTTVTFSGEYAEQPPATASARPARITHGHNKDHRPDLKQLLYNRTVTSDGAVPLHCKIHDGNTPDSKVHRGVVAPFGRNKGKRRRRERFGPLG